MAAMGVGDYAVALVQASLCRMSHRPVCLVYWAPGSVTIIGDIAILMASQI